MPQPKSTVSPPSKRRVLVVEDDPVVSTLFRDYLLMRYEVEVFRSFKAFRTAAPALRSRSEEFLCAVLDYHLLDGNASAVIPMLTMPVIVVTGDKSIKKLRGAAFVLHKPTVFGDLAGCLEKLEEARYNKENGHGDADESI